MEEYLELLQEYGPINSITQQQLNDFRVKSEGFQQTALRGEEPPEEGYIEYVFDYLREQTEMEDFPRITSPGSMLANLVLKQMVEVSKR